MSCGNVCKVRTVAIFGWLLFASLLGAIGPGASEYNARQYRVRADADTGRLVRAVRFVKSESAVVRSGQGRAESVVQGNSKDSIGRGARVDLDSLIRDLGRRFDVDPQLIHAVIRQESAYNVFAVSNKGAKGLMQLMPGTAERFGVKDIFDPAENVRGGVKYLRFLMDRYPGDHRRALAAYNAGEGAVDRYDGIPPYRETQDYVERISRSYGLSDTTSDEASELVETEPVERIVQTVMADGAILFELQ